MSNELTQQEINTSAFLDIVNSFVDTLRKNVCKNVYMITGSYYDDLTNNEMHKVKRSQIPQIAISSLYIEEERARRSFFPTILKNKSEMTYKKLGTPTFYNFTFDFDLIAKSYTEIIVLTEKVEEFWRASDYLIKTMAGFTYPFDLIIPVSSSVVANFSDLCIISYGAVF